MVLVNQSMVFPLGWRKDLSSVDTAISHLNKIGTLINWEERGNSYNLGYLTWCAINIMLSSHQISQNVKCLHYNRMHVCTHTQIKRSLNPGHKLYTSGCMLLMQNDCSHDVPEIKKKQYLKNQKMQKWSLERIVKNIKLCCMSKPQILPFQFRATSCDKLR